MPSTTRAEAPGNGAPDISIIVAQTRDTIGACLDSLERQSLDPQHFEVIVVGLDASAIDGPPRPFSLQYVVCSETNPSLRRNLGMQHAQGRIYAFLDDDAEATPGWLAQALMRFDGDEHLAVLGGPTLLPEGAGPAHALTYKLAHAGFFGNGHENLKQDSDRLEDVLGYIICCNMFVYPGRVPELRPFDIHVGYGGEDTLFVHEVARRNHCGVFYDCKLTVQHSRGAFGLGFLAKRFRYRVNNGLMLWTGHGIYLRNRKFRVGLTLATVLALAVLVVPLLALPLVVVHQAIAFGYALRYLRQDWRLTFLFPPALLAQHVSYYAGVVVGVLSIAHPAQAHRVRVVRKRMR